MLNCKSAQVLMYLSDIGTFNSLMPYTLGDYTVIGILGKYISHEIPVLETIKHFILIINKYYSHGDISIASSTRTPLIRRLNTYEYKYIYINIAFFIYKFTHKILLNVTQ